MIILLLFYSRNVEGGFGELHVCFQGGRLPALARSETLSIVKLYSRSLSFCRTVSTVSLICICETPEIVALMVVSK